MPKVTNVTYTKKRRKRVLKQARGFFGNKSRLYRYAKDSVMRAGVYAYRDRRVRRREFRRLWIVRINSVCRVNGLKYSQFMCALKKMNIALDRKQLSEMAINDEAAFNALIVKVKDSIAK